MAPANTTPAIANDHRLGGPNWVARSVDVVFGIFNGDSFLNSVSDVTQTPYIWGDAEGLGRAKISTFLTRIASTFDQNKGDSKWVTIWIRKRSKATPCLGPSSPRTIPKPNDCMTAYGHSPQPRVSGSGAVSFYGAPSNDDSFTPSDAWLPLVHHGPK